MNIHEQTVYRNLKDWDLELLLNLQILSSAHTFTMVSAHAFISTTID